MEPGSPAVLIVVDEPLIRLAAADAVADDGIKVEAAAHADEALAILHRHASGIGLVFTDINMPGVMDGLELARYVHRHWPWIALVITSGKIRPNSAELPAGARFLRKPYDLEEVLQEARLIVDRTMDDPT